MKKNSLLDNISIVLVDTKTPANIGAAARCMMNMGLSRLLLVNPPKDKAGEAHKLAAGAHVILEQAAVFSTLVDALGAHGLVIGTSRHSGRQRKNIRSPRAMAETVLPMLAENRVALLFGNEVNGLEKKDLALCHEIIAIPSSDDFASLNLSHAVMIVAYELFLASTAHRGQAAAGALARVADTEDFYLHLQETLQMIGFLEHDHPERMMLSFRQLFGRARLNKRDVSILRGVLSTVARVTSEGRKEGKPS
jgi:TrmH family RNA methyltransferase